MVDVKWNKLNIQCWKNVSLSNKRLIKLMQWKTFVGYKFDEIRQFGLFLTFYIISE